MSRRVMRTALACSLLALAAGCETSLPADNPYDPDVPPHEREPGSLAGRVAAEVEIDLEQVLVRVPSAGKSARPDSAGNFEIPDLTPGVHELRIEAPRHRVWRQGGLYVDTGTRVDLGEVRLTAARGALQGTVTLEKIPGVPLDSHGGVLISVRPVAGPGRLAAGEIGKSVASNPDGSWTIDGLIEGDYTVQGTHEQFFNWDTLTVKVTEDEVTPVSEIVMRAISSVIEIDGGAEFTRSEAVTLRVLAFEADEMKLSEDPDLAGADWEPFSVERSWTLGGEDGPAAVYARFRNAEGFLTPIVGDSIVLDRAAPADARVLIAEGAVFVRQRQVSLDLLAADALSGVASMRVALDGDVTDESWIDFTAQQIVELPLGPDETPDGLERTVQAQFRDGAGNESDVVSDTVVLDSVAPQAPAIAIAGGAALTASRTVTLTLSATGATRMIVSNDAGLAGAEWMPYAPSLGWVLTEGEEQKTVFARFADEAGNQTDIVQDGIELNTSGGVSGIFRLEGAAADGHAGITVALSTDPVRTETTDAQGAFAFGGVPVGAYSLRATAAGFDAAQAPYVAVEPGQTTALEPQTLARARGSLRGVARREGAAAAEHGGILVEVEGTELTAVTAAAGQWSIPGVPVGQYTVRASASGYLDAAATDVNVTAGAEALVSDLVLAANPGSVSGAVRVEGRGADEHGGVTILVAGQTVQTLNDGSFSVSDVKAGSYVLKAQLAGFATAEALVVVQPGAESDAGLLTLAVARGDLTGTAEREGDGNRSGILVEVVGTAHSAVTGAGGDWTLRGVPVGQYTVRASAAGFSPAQVTDVVVAEGAATAVGNLLLPADPGSVDGSVTLEGEATDAYGGVLLVLEGSGLSTQSADNGAFAFTAVPAGTYPLKASRDGFATVQSVVTVKAGQPTSAGTLELPIARGAIAGTATLVASDDHSGITVEVDGTGFAGVTGGAGDFRIDSVPVGTYSLTARKQGYLSTTASPVVVEEGKTTTVDLGELGKQQGDFTIEERASGDKEFLNDPAVTLVFSQLPPDPDQIRVAEDDAFSTGAWESFDGAGNTHDHDLLSGDGTVTVYVKFRDAALQESPVFTASAVLDTMPPDPASRVTINGGAAFSDDMDVSLALVGQDATSGVSKMCLSLGASCDPAADRPFQASFSPFRLVDPPPGADGEKTVSVWFVDRAGNRSAGPATASIYLDRVAPVNATVEVNAGTDWTRDALVTLSLSAEDACAAGYPGGCTGGTADPAQMMLSNSSSFPAAQWEPYSTTRAWFLEPGDGAKTVYVKYRDGAGNAMGGFASDDISLDRTAPGDIGISLTELPPDPIIGNGYTNNTQVALNVPAAGADQMRITGDLVDPMPGMWMAYQSPVTATLGIGDGQKTFSVEFRDLAGNLAGPLSTSVIYDGAPPSSGSLTIAGGASHVSSPTVELTLSAVDAVSEIHQMRIANGAVPGGSWEPYATARVWSLAPGDGPKQVTVQFRDRAGNTLDRTEGAFLDTAAPTPVVLTVTGDGGEPAGFSRDSTVSLGLTAADASDGDNLSYCIDNNASFSTATCGSFGAGAPPVTVNGWNLIGGEGVRQVYARVQDRAGNTTVVGAGLVVDGTPPQSGSVSAEENDSRPDNGYTNDRSLTLHLTAAGATAICISGAIDGAGNCGDPDDAGWTPMVDTVNVTLTDVQGDHGVTVEMRDAARNTIPMGAAQVTYDSAAPSSCALSITGTTYDLNDQPQDDEALTMLEDVDLLVNPADATSPITDFQVSNDGMFSDAVWRPYPPFNVDGWRLSPSSGNGEARTVWLKCRDAADNTATSSDSIDLDNTPPTAPGVVIEGGAVYTTDINVDLALTSEAAGTAYARTSVDPVAWPPWEAFPIVGTPSIDLIGIEGLNTVYAMFRDDAGNRSAVASDTILLDQSDPQPPGLLATPGLLDGGTYYTNTLTPTLSWGASVSPDVDHYRVTIDGAEFQTPSLSFGAPALTEGTHSWSVRAVDRAGRESTAINGSGFVCDVTLPTAPQFAEPADSILDAPGIALTLGVETTETNLARYETRSTANPSWFDRGTATGYMLALSQDAENRLRVRAVDKAGNVSDEDFLDVIEDSTPPDAPALLTADQTVNADLFTVFLAATSTSHLDPTFDHYELLGGAFGDWTPVAARDGFVFTLNQGDGVACGSAVPCSNLLELRAVDGADNISGATTVTIAEDSVPPPRPELYPYAEDVASVAIQADQLDVFLVDPAPDPDVDHFEIRGGASGAWSPAGLGPAFRFSLLADAVNVLEVRAVDAAGNLGEARDVTVTEASTLFVPQPSTEFRNPTLDRGRLFWVDVLGAQQGFWVREPGADDLLGTDDDPSRYVAGSGGTYPIAVDGERMAYSDFQGTWDLFIRNAGPDGSFGTGDDTEDRLTNNATNEDSPMLRDEQVIWSQDPGGGDHELMLQAPGNDGLAATGDDPAPVMLDTAPSFGGYNVNSRHAIWRAWDPVEFHHDLWVRDAGADGELGNGDDVTTQLTDAWERSPMDVDLDGDRIVWVHAKDLVIEFLDAGPDRQFGTGDDTSWVGLDAAGFDSEAEEADLDGDRIAWIGKSDRGTADVFVNDAGLDGQFKTADDKDQWVVRHGSIQRNVSTEGGLLAWQDNRNGSDGIGLTRVWTKRWAATTAGDDYGATIDGERLCYFVGNQDGRTIDLDTGETDGGALNVVLDPVCAGGLLVSSNGISGGAEVIDPGADGKLFSADDVIRPIEYPGGYNGWFEFDGQTVVFAQQDPNTYNYSIRHRAPGADGELGTPDDVVTHITDDVDITETDPVVDGEWIAWQGYYGGAFRVRMHWAGPDGDYGTGDDVTAISLVNGSLPQFLPRLAGQRLIYDSYNELHLYEPGPDGMYGNGDDVDTLLTDTYQDSVGSDKHDISTQLAAWVDVRQGCDQIYAWRFDRPGAVRLTDHCSAKQYVHASRGRVAWTDSLLGTKDIWLFEP